MNLEDFVDIKALTKSLASPNKNTIHAWSETAREISPNNYKAIARLRKIYWEIDDLTPQQITIFIEELMRVLPTDEARKSLIRTEALPFRKFDLPQSKAVD